MKFIRPDEKIAKAYAEHVVHALAEHDKAGKRRGLDATRKKILACWLTSLFEVLPEELDDTLRFVQIAHEHQKVLIRFWDPIIIPFAAMYLTKDDGLAGEIYSDYWSIISARRVIEFFLRLLLEEISIEAKGEDKTAEDRFEPDMKVLINTLLADHYESAFRLGLNGDDPEEFAKHLLVNWESAWQILSQYGAEDMCRNTLRLYFLLKHLGYLLARDYSIEFADQVGLRIEEHTKHGWHGVAPK